MPGLIPILAAVAALHSIDVPDTLGSKVDKAANKSGLEVFIPDSFKSDFPKLYPDLRAHNGFYELDLGAAKNCGGGGACGIGYFFGEDGGNTNGGKKVSLHGGITGRFLPTTCGASCGPPGVSWKVGDVAYTIAVKGTPGKEKASMIKLANQAIDAGPR